jgi:hypothetical protein
MCSVGDKKVENDEIDEDHQRSQIRHRQHQARGNQLQGKEYSLGLPVGLLVDESIEPAVVLSYFV